MVQSEKISYNEAAKIKTQGTDICIDPNAESCVEIAEGEHVNL